jgi:hypothetical protein
MKLNYKKLLIAIAPLILLVIFAVGSFTVKPKESGNLYTDKTNGFTITYPGGIEVLNAKSQINSSGYIPACDPDTSVVCFVYPASTYSKSNFSSAGVAVGITGAKSAATCIARGNGEMSTEGPKDINGVIFQAFSFGEGAAGHHTNGLNYRAFYHNACYQLSTRINTTAFDNYEPGTIAEFTMDKEQSVLEALDKIIHSFKFN